jgi:hypothetical protein
MVLTSYQGCEPLLRTEYTRFGFRANISSFERPSSLAFHRDNTRRSYKKQLFTFYSFHHVGHLIALISVSKLIWSLPLQRNTNQIMAVTKMPAGVRRAMPVHVVNR